jgi:hypothetical protein
MLHCVFESQLGPDIEDVQDIDCTIQGLDNRRQLSGVGVMKIAVVEYRWLR